MENESFRKTMPNRYNNTLTTDQVILLDILKKLEKIEKQNIEILEKINTL